jgi:hypothetical protein
MLVVDQPLAKKARTDEDDTEDEDGTDREVVLAAVARNGYALWYAAARLHADREVVLAAVAQDGAALHYSAMRLRTNRQVVLTAVAQDGMALWFASREMKRDREVVLAAVAQDRRAVSFASTELHQLVPRLLDVRPFHSDDKIKMGGENIGDVETPPC